MKYTEFIKSKEKFIMFHNDERKSIFITEHINNALFNNELTEDLNNILDIICIEKHTNFYITTADERNHYLIIVEDWSRVTLQEIEEKEMYPLFNMDRTQLDFISVGKDIYNMLKDYVSSIKEDKKEEILHPEPVPTDIDMKSKTSTLIDSIAVELEKLQEDFASDDAKLIKFSIISDIEKLISQVKTLVITNVEAEAIQSFTEDVNSLTETQSQNKEYFRINKEYHSNRVFLRNLFMIISELSFETVVKKKY